MEDLIIPASGGRQALLEGAGEVSVGAWIRPWDFQEDLEVGIIGAPLARAGSRYKGVDRAPNALREAFSGNWPFSSNGNFDFSDLRVRDLGDIRMHPTSVVACQENIERALSDLHRLRSDFLLIILGGDHSIPLPAVTGLCRARRERAGVIWFDAHHDMMDLAWGGPSSASAPRAIIEANAGVSGQNFVQVGMHEFANAPSWRRYADQHGVTTITAADVRRKGIQHTVEEAISIASDGTDFIYISLDVDVFDQIYVPGHVVPSPLGLSPWDMVEALDILGRCPQVRAMDLVCIDPTRDLGNMTVRLGCTLVLALIAGYYKRLRQGGLG